MSHFNTPVQEVHAYQTQEIPDCLKSNNSAQAIRANNRHVQLSASSSSSQNSGGVILFQIPPTQAALSRGSMFLRFRVSVTGATAGAITYASAAASVGFQGPGSNAGSTNYIPTFGHAMSTVQRMTLYGSGSAVVDQINFTNSLYDLWLSHHAAANYVATDGGILLGCQRTWDINAATTGAQIDVCVPVPLAVFNNSSIDFPMYLMRNNLTLQVDLASFGRAIFTSLAGISDYTISNPYLCYELLEVPSSLVESERHIIHSHPFVMPLTSWMNTQITQGVLSSYNLGLNCSSLRAVYVQPLAATAYAANTQVAYSRAFSDSSTNWGSGVNALVYLDGMIKNSNINSDPTMQFAMLKQALNNNVQSNILYPSGSGWASYLASTFTLGIDCTSFSDESTIFGGSACSNLNIQVTTFANPNNLANVLVCYDVILAISGDGVMEVKR